MAGLTSQSSRVFFHGETSLVKRVERKSSENTEKMAGQSVPRRCAPLAGRPAPAMAKNLHHFPDEFATLLAGGAALFSPIAPRRQIFSDRAA
jgi:hypothetical protein